jgi:hypothetical protein
LTLAVAAGLSALWALALADSAAALPSHCTQSGATVTCTFSRGSEGTFAVPARVSRAHVIANGGAGGGTLGGAGGPGAQVSSNLDVTPGSTLFVEVDIGGGAGADAARGGGESDVRICSITDSSCHAVDGSAQDPRLVVAGGGGGAGNIGAGGNGGAGGVGTASCNPGMNGTSGAIGNVGGGGHGGGCTSGGTGGAPAAGGVVGGNGTASSGGNGGSLRGGGGGAGFFGGGGGGGGFDIPFNGGGGGGGSSFAPAGSVFATGSTMPSVVISYTLPLLVPTSKHQCLNGGWENFTDSNDDPFKNEGQCISFVETGK